MTLNAAQRKKVSSGRISDAADVMLEQTMHLIKCVLLKHETAQLEVMAEMQDRIATLEQQVAELVAAVKKAAVHVRPTCPDLYNELEATRAKVKQP